MQQVRDPNTIIQSVSSRREIMDKPAYIKYSWTSGSSNSHDPLFPVIVASFVLFINLLQIISL